MNVSYKEISTTDAARMLKVDKSSVSNWCREGIINFTNVGDGPNKSRYLISEEEVDQISKCIKKHGKRRWTKFYDKDWNKAKEKNPVILTSDEALFLEEVKEQKQQEAQVESSAATLIKNGKVDIDSVAITIGYIQDIKEKLEDLEAEKAQLLNEYAQLKKEIEAIL